MNSIYRECARLVLGVEFHQLPEEDVIKVEFKKAIGDVYSSLQVNIIIYSWNNDPKSMFKEEKFNK